MRQAARGAVAPAHSPCPTTATHPTRPPTHLDVDAGAVHTPLRVEVKDVQSLVHSGLQGWVDAWEGGGHRWVATRRQTPGGRTRQLSRHNPTHPPT